MREPVTKSYVNTCDSNVQSEIVIITVLNILGKQGYFINDYTEKYVAVKITVKLCNAELH